MHALPLTLRHLASFCFRYTLFVCIITYAWTFPPSIVIAYHHQTAGGWLISLNIVPIWAIFCLFWWSVVMAYGLQLAHLQILFIYLQIATYFAHSWSIVFFVYSLFGYNGSIVIFFTCLQLLDSLPADHSCLLSTYLTWN